MKPLTTTLAALLLSASATAQFQINASANLGPNVPGSLTTYFVSDTGYGGNMFDIQPQVDLEITGMDINASAVATTVEIEVWIRVGTSVGNETNPLGDWFELKSGQPWTGTGAGTDQPTFIDLSNNGYTFLAGQTYGMFVSLRGVTATNTIRYTNAPATTYSNADLSITTHAGRGTGGFNGFVFVPREWNGTIYYDDDPTANDPILMVSNLTAGQTATITMSNVPDGNEAVVAYSLAGGGPISSPYGDVFLSLPYTALPTMTASGGSATWTVGVPGNASGVQAWFHGLDMTACRLSNPLELTVN